MGLSKTEINLKRLLAAAPQQSNKAKLIHYVATLREQLEQLANETASEGLPRISKAKLNDYSEKIEALTANLAAPLPISSASYQSFNRRPQNISGTSTESSDLFVLMPVSTVPVLPESNFFLPEKETKSYTPGSLEAADETAAKQVSPKADEGTHLPSSPGLRRRFVSHTNVEGGTHEITETDPSAPIKLDASAQAHIEKHRKLQEDLTDEMVGLARQLKESSLLMNQSLQDTEKILDSTERAVEHSLASTGHANTRAMKIYSESFKTTCFTWGVIFVMTCIFIMVVLLIRIT